MTLPLFLPFLLTPAYLLHLIVGGMIVLPVARPFSIPRFA
jgi:hypothetical protein